MGCTGSKTTENASAPKDKPQRDRRMSAETPLLRASDFKVGAYIQTGAMGKVYKGTRIKDNKAVAMKFFGYTAKTPDENDAYEEINLMTALRGVQGMVQLEGVFTDPPAGIIDGKRFAVELPVIVMEHLAGGDLMDRILMSKFVSEKQLAAIFRRIIGTLKECHRRGFIHRDLKLENIIFESNKDDALVKIVDFGMMVRLDKNKGAFYTLLIQGTPGYLAPESITEMEYSPKTDFFAAGCCFYAMLSGEMPFDPSDARAPAKIPYAPMTGKAWENISDEAKSFLDFMLQPDKNARPDADQILAHPWLSGQANDANLDTEYFSRLKSLALRQKIRTFFADNNIWDNNRKKQAKLNRVVSSYRTLNSPPLAKKRPSIPGTTLETIQENEDLKAEYERKLHKLRAVVIKTLKPDFSFEHSDGSTQPEESQLGSPDESVFRGRQASVSSVASASDDVLELSATFRKYVLENDELPLEGFIELLKCVGLDDFANEEVFKIFDAQRSGSIDMKDFLITMIAMKSVEETAVVPMPTSSSATNSDVISLPRRSTAIRLVDDAKLYFDMFDVKQNGYIDIDELKLVMDFMVPESDEEAKEAMNKNIEEMFQIMDMAKNGRVDFEEFKTFYNAVMVASTKLKINAPHSMSFAKAIDLVQRRASSSDFNDDHVISRSSSRSPSFT